MKDKEFWQMILKELQEDRFEAEKKLGYLNGYIKETEEMVRRSK